MGYTGASSRLSLHFAVERRVRICRWGPGGHRGKSTTRPFVLEVRVIDTMNCSHCICRVSVGRRSGRGGREKRVVYFGSELLLAELVIELGFLFILCGAISHAFAARGIGDWRRHVQR